MNNLTAAIRVLQIQVGMYICIYIHTEDDFGGVETHFLFVKDAVLRQMIVQVASVHQIEDKTQFVRRVEGVCHTDNEWTVGLNTTESIARV